jgi:hypothetical protein
MTMLRHAFAAAALVTLAACGSDDSSSTQPASAPISLNVVQSTAPRSGAITAEFRNTSSAEVQSGTWCIDGGYEQQVNGQWQAIGRVAPQACTLPLVIWAPGQTRTETVDMAQAAPQLVGTGPWTLRLTYRVTGAANTIIRSDAFTVTP